MPNSRSNLARTSQKPHVLKSTSLWRLRFVLCVSQAALNEIEAKINKIGQTTVTTKRGLLSKIGLERVVGMVMTFRFVFKFSSPVLYSAS